MSGERARIFDALLLAAVIAAILTAFAGIVTDSAPINDDVVAVVNDRRVTREEFQSYLDAVAAQLKRSLDAKERAAVLERFIDEELLLQESLALELPRHDSRVRGQLVQLMIQHAVSASTGEAVETRELEAFYAANSDYFRRPAMYRVRRYDVGDPETAAQLRAAGPYDIADDEPLARFAPFLSPYLPDTWLPAAKLRDYLGSESVKRIEALQVGETLTVDGPDARRSVLVLVDRREAYTPELAEISAQVESEYRRRRDEKALEAYVARLRRQARIQLASDTG